MQKLGQHSDPITLVISEVVEPNLIEEYETWSKGINQSAQQFEGFLGVEIIRPRDHQYPEYVVIVKFENYSHCKNWLNSPVYKQWMQRSQEFISTRSQQYQAHGLELWFTLPNNKSENPIEPPYYKQIIIGVITVYPLILLSNLLIAPFLQALPALLSLLISVIFVSVLYNAPYKSDRRLR